LLANADATSAEAEELIGELEELIEEADPTVYVSMNIPYGDFYGSEDVDYYFDVVSTATTSKFLGTTGLAKGTYNDGTDILGVVYPVAMRTSVYNTLKDSSLTENDDYYIAELLEEAPAAYKTLTYADGTYSFSEATGEEGDASGLSVGEADTTSSYGDYMIELVGVLTADGITIGGTTDINPSGVILETADGSTYGMGMLENMWVGTRVINAEVAFSVVEGNGLTNHGGVAFKQFEGLNGATITSVKLVTNKGIYTIECSVVLPEYYAGEDEIAAEITDAETLTISIPDAYENVTVSVSYTSGRTAVYVAENAEVVDGTVALSGVLDEETTYTVTVYSSNYAATKLTVTYGEPTEDTGITEEQIARLNELIEIGQALVDEDASLTILASHIAEAQELLANADATSAEAEELISELEELITDAGGDISSDDTGDSGSTDNSGSADGSGSAEGSGSSDSSGSTDDSGSTDTSGNGSSSGRPASSNATSHGSSSGGGSGSSSSSASSVSASSSTWVQDVENDDNTWRLRKTDGSYAVGSVTTDESGNTHEQIAWAQVNGAWYAFGADGYAAQGWVLDYAAGKWYFIDIDDGMKSNWHHDDQDNYWYYLDPSSGAMRIGWNQIDGTWYYFNSNPVTYTWNYEESTGTWVYDTNSVSKPLGAMYAGETTPDGYAVDGNGAWIQ
ncbi:MAG: hypothetical protein LUD07_10165, partial [Clostridiales bacterium]|nr:hypothetical protein [Clostridiales bacterium]